MTVDGKVLRLDRRTGRIVAQVPGTFKAADLAVGAEGVWVYDQHQGAVLRIDPGTNRVVRTIPVISQPLVELYSRVLALGGRGGLGGRQGRRGPGPGRPEPLTRRPVLVLRRPS